MTTVAARALADEADPTVRSRSCYLVKRGFSVAEVEETIRNAPWTSADLGRMECQRDFPFGREWNGVVYATKRIRPIFVEEAGELMVVTVYTYYF